MSLSFTVFFFFLVVNYLFEPGKLCRNLNNRNECKNSMLLGLKIFNLNILSFVWCIPRLGPHCSSTSQVIATLVKTEEPRACQDNIFLFQRKRTSACNTSPCSRSPYASLSKKKKASCGMSSRVQVDEKHSGIALLLQCENVVL